MKASRQVLTFSGQIVDTKGEMIFEEEKITKQAEVFLRLFDRAS
jgi:hypothetical protein